jgi:hypothetical protein
VGADGRVEEKIGTRRISGVGAGMFEKKSVRSKFIREQASELGSCACASAGRHNYHARTK